MGEAKSSLSSSCGVANGQQNQKTFPMTGRTDMGLRSDGWAAAVLLGTGVTLAFFHPTGTSPLAKLWLESLLMLGAMVTATVTKHSR